MWSHSFHYWLSYCGVLTTFANIRIVEREELFPHMTQCWQTFLKMVIMENFPGDLVVKTPCFQCRGHRFDPWSGKFHMPQRVWQKRKEKKKDCYHRKSMDVEVRKPWSSNSGSAHFDCEMSINTMFSLYGQWVHCNQKGALSGKTTKAGSPEPSQRWAHFCLELCWPSPHPARSIHASSFSSDESSSGRPDCFPSAWLYLTPLCLNFSICKMGMIILPTSWQYFEEKMFQYMTTIHANRKHSIDSWLVYH